MAVAPAVRVAVKTELSRRNDAIIVIVCAANTTLMLLWPLVIVDLRIPDLIGWGTTYFVQNKKTVILPGDTRRTTSELPDVGAKLEAQRFKMFHNNHFLQCDMVFGIINSFSWMFDAVSSEKSCTTSMLFLLTYTELRQEISCFRPEQFFRPAESWLANSNFRRDSRIQETSNFYILKYSPFSQEGNCCRSLRVLKIIQI